jgi:outer membrane protein TolC
MTKNSSFIKVVLTFSLVGSWALGKCQSQADSLYSYLEIAARNNPTVLQRYFEYESALHKVPQVGGLPDPEVSLGVYLRPMELIGGNQLADIRLMQMFPWFGVLKSSKDEMSLMAKAKYESFRDAKLQVYYDVQRSWYELYKVNQNIRITEMNMDILKTIEELAVGRFKAFSAGNTNSLPGKTSGSSQNSPSGSQGMISMGVNLTANNPATPPMQNSSMGSAQSSTGLPDVYRIQIEINDLFNNIELLKDQRKTVIAQFNNFLNRDPSTPMAIPDTLLPDNYQAKLSDLTDSAFINNPMLGMLQYEQQSLNARKQMVTRMGYPMVGLGLNYSVVNKSEMSKSSMNGKDMIMPMVTATLPIYRRKYSAMQSEIEMQKSATVQNYEATANALQTEYYQALQLYQDSKRRIKLYSNQIELASKTLEIMIKSYASSGSDLSEILRLRQQMLDYKFRQVEAVADLNTSIAWLKRLMAFSQ